MDQKTKIPIMVGVTGHRLLREEDRPALYAAVKGELNKIRERCPHSELIMLCSMAEGADLLCAEAAHELGIPLIAALPMAAEEYEKDFSADGLAQFRTRCAEAGQVFVTPPTEPVPETIDRDFQYRQAGIYVAAHCHILLALWDGGEGKPSACGTAEAVDFALHGAYSPASGASMRSESNEAVVHIFTPRGDRTGEPAGAVHVLGHMEAVLDVLDKTEEFNRLTEEHPAPAKELLPPDRPDDPILKRMAGMYVTADNLSVYYAGIYRRILALLAAFSMILTLSFLLYDEAEAEWMIFVCGAMILLAWLTQRIAARSACHRRYIEYRALAESFRVQAFLRYAGSHIETATLLSWTQQEETAWILDALCALAVGPLPGEKRSIRDSWVEGQRSYHARAQGRSLRKNEVSGRMVSVALWVSVGLYLAALGFEILCGGWLMSAVIPVRDVEIYRTVLKIVLGAISASTLFIANYYGKLSLPRQVSDHTKMARFYARMSEQIALRGQTEELLSVLAREELIENGNWCSYQRDNTPDISF